MLTGTASQRSIAPRAAAAQANREPVNTRSGNNQQGEPVVLTLNYYLEIMVIPTSFFPV